MRLLLLFTAAPVVLCFGCSGLKEALQEIPVAGSLEVPGIRLALEPSEAAGPKLSFDLDPPNAVATLYTFAKAMSWDWIVDILGGLGGLAGGEEPPPSEVEDPPED